MALNIFSRLCLGRANLLVNSNQFRALAFKKNYSFQTLNSLLISQNINRSLKAKNGFNVGVLSKTRNLSTEVGQIAPPRMRITFTCNVCSERLTRTFLKESYEKTVVLIKCPGCSNHHIIADNLGWFSDLKGKK